MNEKINISQKKFPIFMECVDYTVDPYWIQVFEDCAKGKFPRGSGIDKTGKTVHFKIKNEIIWFSLPEEPSEIFIKLKEKFQDILRLKSNIDRDKTRDEMNLLKKNIEENYSKTWKNIKKKSIKCSLIREYTLSLKEKYELSEEQTIKLYNLINLGFIFNCITLDHVIYEDKKITDITSLIYENNEFTFDSEIKFSKRKFVPKSIKLSSFWNKKPKEKNIV